MYGMGLGISVWDGSRDWWVYWCMLEGPLTETLSSSFKGPVSRGPAGGGTLRFDPFWWELNSHFFTQSMDQYSVHCVKF